MTHDARRLEFDRRPRKRRLDHRCQLKRRFVDELSARAVGMLSIEERGNVDKLYVYRCPHCSGWHLTKQKKEKRWLVTAQEPAAA